MAGAIARVEEMAAEDPRTFVPQQFENPANPEYHANTTGPEILRDFAGRRLDFWVTGYCTGGTLSGAGKVLKKARPDLTIVATEPAGAALLAGVGAGVWPDVDTASEACIKVTGSTAPRSETVARYEPLYAQYRALYPALKAISHNLSQLA